MILYKLGVRPKASNPMPPRATGLATRPPAVAGQFYDADPHQLGSEVRRLLALAPRPVTSVRPKAIIVPHAAYLYSGPVAATAFAALAPSGKTIERIRLDWAGALRTV